MRRKSRDTTDTPTKEPLWDPKAGAGGRSKHLGVRWTIFTLIALALIALIAGAFRPVNQTVNVLPAQAGVSSVGQYAAAFTTDWFTWDATKRTDRAERLSVYNPSFTSAGWDGNGTQRVTQARVFDQEELGDNQFLITVRLQVDTTPAAFYVQVLAASDGNGFAILSAPALIPAPPLISAQLPSRSNTEQDLEVVDAIRSQVRLFLNAWATADEALEQFTRDGITIEPVGGGVELVDISDIHIPPVAEGASPDVRTVVATVRWGWPGGGSAPTAYSIGLERTSGKWFVTSVDGGVGDPSVAPSASRGADPEPTPDTSAPEGDEGAPQAPETNPDPEGDSADLPGQDGPIVDPPFDG